MIVAWTLTVMNEKRNSLNKITLERRHLTNNVSYKSCTSSWIATRPSL